MTKRIRLVNIRIQLVFMLDDGENLEPIEHPVTVIPGAERPTYSSDGFPREVAEWQRNIEAESGRPPDQAIAGSRSRGPADTQVAAYGDRLTEQLSPRMQRAAERPSLLSKHHGTSGRAAATGRHCGRADSACGTVRFAMKDKRNQKLDSYTSTRTDVTAMLPNVPHRLLDVGCSDGSLAQTVKHSGAVAWGIELDADFAARAAERLDQVLHGDALEQTTKLLEAGERFDAIICADSLEHMVDPWAVLRNIRRLLADDGVVVVSLPNVHFYTTFTGLLFCHRWHYKERGIHDRTHLRWFTDHNAREMFEQAQLRVIASRTYYRTVDRPARINRFASYLAVGPFKRFFAYQYIYRLAAAS